MVDTGLVCPICGEAGLARVGSYDALPRVSSDCKPIAPGGTLVVCEHCGSISKPVDAEFLREIGEIYDAYDVYYQGGGAEQLVVDFRSGGQLRRSDVLTRELRNHFPAGRALLAIDVGCGNGGFLRALSSVFPDWQLYGLELDGRHRESMRDIPGFADLIEGQAETLEGTFDFISLIHALEHFTQPYDALVRLRDNLTDTGVLFIEIPNAAQNPFDLLIADHVSHFTPETLNFLLVRAGYEVISLETDWVKKEMSVLARRATKRPDIASIRRGKPETVFSAIDWLGATYRLAESAASAPRFGIFGTSIAATWLTGGLGDKIEFFVDEDASRQGRSFFGKPILAPRDVPADSSVFIATAPAVADVIKARMQKTNSAQFLSPPVVDNVI